MLGDGFVGFVGLGGGFRRRAEAKAFRTNASTFR
jgi:hypothetical protein